MIHMEIESGALQLTGAAWDHLVTQHGLEAAQATHYGWRKSHWYGNEGEIEGFVTKAFDVFRLRAIDQGPVLAIDTDDQHRYVINEDIGTPCGTRGDGEPTSSVRLVLVMKNSGGARVVTAFPV